MDKRHSILVVGDDTPPREALRELLQKEGYLPITASTCEQALEAVRKHKPVVAVIDLWLADLPGHVVLHGIRQQSPETECIALQTTPAQLDGAYEALNLGAFTFLRRGYDTRQLLVTVQRAIEKRESARALEEVKERLTVMFDNLPAGVLILDERTRMVVDANPAAAAFIGASRASIIGSVLQSRMLTSGQPLVEPTPTAAPGPNGASVTLRQTGRRLAVTRTVATINISGRRHLIESFVDLSGALVAEDQLATALAINHILAENVSDLVLTVDAEGRVLHAPLSPHAKPGVSLSGEDSIALLPVNCRERYRQALRDVFRDGRGVAFSAGTPPLDSWAVRADPVVSRGETIAAVVRLRDLLELGRASEQINLRSLAIDRAREALLIVNTEGTIVDANDAACRLLEYESVELIGMPFKQVEQPDAARPWSKVWAQITAQGQLELDSRVQPRGAVFKAVRLHIHHVTTSGTALAFIFIEDSGSRQQMSGAVRDGTSRERSLLNADANPAWLLDRRGHIINVNEAAARLSGKSAADLVGVTYDRILAEDLARARLSRVEDVFIRGNAVETEGQSGGRLYVTTFSPLRDHAGAVVLVMVCARDVTEHREREQMRELLWAQAPTALLTLIPGAAPAAMTLEAANPQALGLFACATLSELQGRFAASIPESGAGKLGDALQHVLQEAGAAPEFELEFTPPAGKPILTSIRLAAWPAVAGRPRRVLMALVDRSAWRDTQLELIETSALERQRIRQELDAMVLRPLRELVAPGADPATLATRLDELANQTQHMISGLAWDHEGELSLIAALGRLSDQSQARWGIACRCNLRAAGLVVDRVRGGHVFAIAREALDLAVRQRGAKQVTIVLSAAGKDAALAIRDDGAAPTPTRDEDAAQRLMRIHAEMIHATLSVDRDPRGTTTLTCTFPGA